jgi:hypothetical protein
MLTVEPIVRWLLSAVFAVVGSWYAVGAVMMALRGAREYARPIVSRSLHIMMCINMVAMFWVWGGRISPPVQVAVFGAATLWFLVGAIKPTRVDGARQVKEHDWFHAASMGAMVWMAYLMATGGAHQKTGASIASPHAMSMHEGMTLSYEGMGGPSEWIGATCAIGALAFAVVAAAKVGQVIPGSLGEETELRDGHLAGGLVEGLMALGTAGVLFALS